MPIVQEIPYAGADSARVADTGVTPRFLGGAHALSWNRLDWNVPVGAFSDFKSCRHELEVEGVALVWWSFTIAEFYLGHRAAMFLLQGQRLSDLLLPSHCVSRATADGSVTHYGEVGQLLLRVDPWEYWRPRPALTGLRLATVEAVPSGLAYEKVVGALAAASAA